MKKNCIESLHIPLYRKVEGDYLSDQESIKKLQDLIEQACLLFKTNGYDTSCVKINFISFEDEVPLIACDECETEFYNDDSEEMPISGQELLDLGFVRKGHSHLGRKLCDSCLPVVEDDNEHILTIKGKATQH